VIEAGRGKQGRRVAKGYFGRPQLLDSLYIGSNSKPNRSETAISDSDSCSVAVRADLPRQDNKNTSAVSGDVAVSCYDSDLTHVQAYLEVRESPNSDEEEPEDPPVPVWMQQVEQKMKEDRAAKKS
jgi:hypothetical protein